MWTTVIWIIALKSIVWSLFNNIYIIFASLILDVITVEVKFEGVLNHTTKFMIGWMVMFQDNYLSSFILGNRLYMYIDFEIFWYNAFNSLYTCMKKPIKASVKEKHLYTYVHVKYTCLRSYFLRVVWKYLM